MTIRTLPTRPDSLPHTAPGVHVPEGVPQAAKERHNDGIGLPSTRTIHEREFLANRRAQTMAVSRREEQGARGSNAGQPPVRLVDRIDPVWEISYEDQFKGSPWRQVSATRHRVTVNSQGSVVARSDQSFAPIELSPAEAYTERMMRIMALLFQFGGLTTSQLCSFLDTRLQSLSGALHRLYGMGLVERMTPTWVRPFASSDRLYHGSGDVWRINLRSGRVEDWMSGLSSTEVALMTGGRDAKDLLHGGAFLHNHTLRHNLAVAELALRALETMPGIVGVWGEPFLSGERFLPEVIRGSIDVRYVRGDAAIVTKDGAVVIIELTGVRDTRAEHGYTLAARAAAWAAIASWSEVPMSVVFVTTRGYRASRTIYGHLRKNVPGEIAKYFPRENQREQALNAIHMAPAEVWWPSAQTISRKFVTMEAKNPFTGDYRELAPADAQLDPSLPVVVNTVAALHSPGWALQPVKPIVDGEGE